MIKKNFKLSTFAILVCFITIIAISCSEKATEPEVSLSETGTVQPGEGTVTPPVEENPVLPENPSTSYNSIADLYGKSFRTVSSVTADNLWYLWIKVEEGKIQYERDLASIIHFDKFKEATLSADGSFASATITGTLHVGGGVIKITFTGGDDNAYKGETFTLIEK